MYNIGDYVKIKDTEITNFNKKFIKIVDVVKDKDKESIIGYRSEGCDLVWTEDILEKRVYNIIEAINFKTGSSFHTANYSNGKIDKYIVVVIQKNGEKFLAKNGFENNILDISFSNLNKIFIKIESKPISFEEAVKSKKEIRVNLFDLVLNKNDENIKNLLNQFNTLSNIIDLLSNNYYSDDMRKIFSEGKWYIKES